ncbi:hypothetical protein N658DRAFT_414359 [Parathielavia hyrcaniae]|uniref:Uncharacterized protein n=1 Tax=Parathielavia hyrcaniae TaxID=113614 RepID=A0AAN6QAZ5_9PEZI|nr:hypothetical protein N658DRAFT_414359 [Parathielavia hyrcaniae]
MSGIALKLLKKQVDAELGKRNTNYEDPYYVQVERNGRKRTDKRPIPEGLSANDRKILKEIRRRAHRLDQSFSFCGFRFGWSAFIGMFPVIGDAIEVLISLMMIKKAAKVDGGLPKRLYSMMFTNIMLDFAIGFVPLLGDLADAWFRANTRNAWLLDAYLTAKAEAIQKKVIVDPDTGKSVPVPRELLGTPTTEDVEQGVRHPQMAESARATPAAVPPARTLAPKTHSAPGRNLTSQGGIRHVQDPRDKAGRKT